MNRIRITGSWASSSLTSDPALTFSERAREYRMYSEYRVAMTLLDIAFYVTRLRQWIWGLLGRTGVGFEDELERSMRGFARTTLE